MNHETAYRSYVTWGMAIAIAIVAAIAFWPEDIDSSSVAESHQAVDPLLRTPTPPAATSSSESAQADSAIEDLARLIDLGVSGDLRVDANMRGTLDVLMAELGPTPSAEALQQLEASMRHAMPDEAATQAIALVRSYAGYTQAATAQAQALASKPPPANAAEVKALLDQSIALRRKHFDAATADALFGVEEAQARYALAEQAIHTNSSLSAQEKTLQLQALRNQMPHEAAALKPTQPLAIAEMEDKVASLRAQGAPADQIYQLRQRYLGADAAASLASMEAQRAEWDTRYQAYLSQKKALSTAAGPELDSLQRKHFSEEELAALRAYDRSHPQ